MTAPRRILVTSALPYANGPIHLGYLLEAVQTDIWVRFQKLRGHECWYVCADDTHGTPIMLKAQSEGITAEQLIAQVNVEHKRDLADMLIGIDNFGSTHSPENRALCESLYRTLRAADYIERRTISQAYDEKAGMFLPDRYVRGTCPNCGAVDQYGDSCEVCGATYTPADLKNPTSVITGTAPVARDSEHYFFRLSGFEGRLKSWVGSGTVQESVARKLGEWFSQGLRDWDISRDAPYFGFEIPDAPGKFFYVWFDAPIGYLASFTQLCARTGLKFEDFFGADKFFKRAHSSMEKARAAGLRVRLDADFFQQKTRGEIEQPVERIKREVKPVQRPRRCQRDRQRLLDRQPFRREFARRDVQERQRAEADGEGNRVLPDDGFDAERNQQRRKQRREHRLADPAEAKARHRDAKLRRAQIRIQIADNVLRRPRAALFFYDERVELRFADADERELGGDEKSVQQHQHEHGEDF